MATTPKSARATIAKVNAALLKRWPEQGYEIHKHSGGFSVAGGDAHKWPESFICTYRISDLTIGGWCDEIAALRRRWIATLDPYTICNNCTEQVALHEDGVYRCETCGNEQEN